MDPGWAGTTTTVRLWYSTGSSDSTWGASECYALVYQPELVPEQEPEIPDNRQKCRTGWRSFRCAVIDRLYRSARRWRRGFTRENIGCSNYCRSPA